MTDQKPVLLKVNLHVPPSEGLFDRLYQIGTEEFGLVQSRDVFGNGILDHYYSGCQMYHLRHDSDRDLIYHTKTKKIVIPNIGLWAFGASRLNESIDHLWLRIRSKRVTRPELEADLMRPFYERILREAKDLETKYIRESVIDDAFWQKIQVLYRK